MTSSDLPIGIFHKDRDVLLRRSAICPDHWLERLYCTNHGHSDWVIYCNGQMRLAEPRDYARAVRTIDPRGNPAIGEHTLRHSRGTFYQTDAVL